MTTLAEPCLLCGAVTENVLICDECEQRRQDSRATRLLQPARRLGGPRRRPPEHRSRLRVGPLAVSGRAPSVAVRPAAELERRHGGRRILKAGDLVKVDGERGLFKIQAFRGNEVDVYGGPPNRERLRTFRLERIGRRPRRAVRRE